MKRAPELQPLSRDHHHALVVARRLRRAAAGEESLAGAMEALRAAWSAQIQPHFREEESLLLPAFAAAAGPEDRLILRTLTEHVALRLALRRVFAGVADAALAGEIGQRLDDHIRFEERVLFPAVEVALPPEEMEHLGRELAAACAERPEGCGL